MPLWVHEYILNQLSLYGAVKWDRIPSWINEYEVHNKLYKRNQEKLGKVQ
jgi:hypothetical protein